MGSAIKIKENAKFIVNIIYIADFIKSDEKEKNIENSIVYFLCNSFLIKEVVGLLEKMNCYIFNKNFFEKNYTKLEMQKILRNNNIAIPKILKRGNLDKTKSPVFVNL